MVLHIIIITGGTEECVIARTPEYIGDSFSQQYTFPAQTNNGEARHQSGVYNARYK